VNTGQGEGKCWLIGRNCVALCLMLRGCGFFPVAGCVLFPVMTTSPFPEELSIAARSKSPESLAVDESFWARVAGEYDCDPSFIQLNYGFYHPAARTVVEAEVAALRAINRRGSHFKWRDAEALFENARRELAQLAGVDPAEIVITRNASEALNIVIQGLALGAGDEVVCTNQEYTATDQAWDQRARQDGIRVRRVAVPLDPASDEEIIRLFEAEITDRTRVIEVPHLVHFTGQVLPVEKLGELARRRGLPILVDAAHSFAQLDFSIRELNCDYLAASLHKWLGAPLGTGLLYVRADRIAGVRPFFGDTHFAEENIRKLERFGNRPDSAFAGIRTAIQWHHAIGGTAVKQARLAELQRSWTEPLRRHPRYRLLTPGAAGRHGAIGTFTLEGVPPEDVFNYLREQFGIFTVVQKSALYSGVRVTPGLPTSREHIVRLVEALTEAAAHFA